MSCMHACMNYIFYYSFYLCLFFFFFFFISSSFLLGFSHYKKAVFRCYFHLFSNFCCQFMIPAKPSALREYNFCFPHMERSSGHSPRYLRGNSFCGAPLKFTEDFKINIGERETVLDVSLDQRKALGTTCNRLLLPNLKAYY